jgi:outer membrane receptor protein involved in Fe transport
LNAREWGLELELESRPVSGLTLSAALSSLHSVLYNVTEPSLVVVDRYLPQAPKLSGNIMMRYEHSIGEGVASVQLTGRYWDNYCWSVFCGAVDIERPGYAADLRLAYETGPFRFAFGVTNLTNRVYRVYEDDTTAAGGGQITSVYALPRWYTGSVTVKFGRPK